MALISPSRRLQWIIKEEVRDDSTDSTESGENDSTASEAILRAMTLLTRTTTPEDADNKTTTVDKQHHLYLVMRREMAQMCNGR